MPSSIPLRVMLMKYNWIHTTMSCLSKQNCLSYILFHTLSSFYWSTEWWSSAINSLPWQYVGSWQLGSIKYHLAFWSKNWEHCNLYQWKVQTVSLPSGNKSTCVYMLGRKGRRAGGEHWTFGIILAPDLLLTLPTVNVSLIEDLSLFLHPPDHFRLACGVLCALMTISQVIHIPCFS